MSLELSPERRQLQSVAAEMLDAQAPPALARAFLEDRGDARVLWGTIAEMGWYGAGLDPDDPFGITGLCLLAEQCGAHAAPTALCDTAVAARLAVPLDGADLAVGLLAGGDATAALGLLEAGHDWIPVAPETTLRAGADGHFILSGEKLGLRHAAAVDLLAIVARGEGGVAVAFVDPDAPGVTITPVDGLDAAAVPGRVRLEGVQVSSSAVVLDAERALIGALDVGTIVTAAEGLGAATRALAMAVEYSRERRQFGRPIGSFQALQHIMADAHIEREIAWSTVLAAAGELDRGEETAGAMVSLAKARAARASRTVTEIALQVHGGIAFTWEHDIHLFQRRVLDCERRFGDAIDHEHLQGELIARRAGDELALSGVSPAG
jgi:alkylation response protein AidB-like acyl-CoA dehydrogenase